MNANERRDETTQPLSILNSTLPTDGPIDALVKIRSRTCPGDGVEDEGVRGLVFALGRSSDACLQIVFEADGGCGRVTLRQLQTRLPKRPTGCPTASLSWWPNWTCHRR